MHGHKQRRILRHTGKIARQPVEFFIRKNRGASPHIIKHHIVSSLDIVRIVSCPIHLLIAAGSHSGGGIIANLPEGIIMIADNHAQRSG